MTLDQIVEETRHWPPERAGELVGPLTDGQRQLFLSTSDNYFFPVAWVNSFMFLSLS
jgi:hypothetical protein